VDCDLLDTLDFLLLGALRDFLDFELLVYEVGVGYEVTEGISITGAPVRSSVHSDVVFDVVIVLLPFSFPLLLLLQSTAFDCFAVLIFTSFSDL